MGLVVGPVGFLPPGRELTVGWARGGAWAAKNVHVRQAGPSSLQLPHVSTCGGKVHLCLQGPEGHQPGTGSSCAFCRPLPSPSHSVRHSLCALGQAT